MSTEETKQTITAAEYINSQLELEQEAREVLPYSFDTCTYLQGSLRQPIYSCKTHKQPNGTGSAVCYSCSISCHSECDLVELFTKRNVQCDCGTTRTPGFACTLRKTRDDIPADSNVYCHNYDGRFCVCDQLYDIGKESGTMYQCLLGDGCNEDWFHDTCIVGVSKAEEDIRVNQNPEQNLKTEPIEPTEDTKEAGEDTVSKKEPTEDKPKEENTAAEEEEEEEELDPRLAALPSDDDFEFYICWNCVEKNPWLKHYSGKPGFLPGVPHGQPSEAAVVKEEVKSEEIEAAKATAEAEEPRGTKRKSPEGEESESQLEEPTKRTRTSDTTESASSTSTKTTLILSPDASSILFKTATTTDTSTTTTHTTITTTSTTSTAPPACILPSTPPPTTPISLFLAPDFREHLCPCPTCAPLISRHPILLNHLPSYSPPLSRPSTPASSSGSLLERGEKALNMVDRVRAIEGVMAYNSLRDKVKSFLKPFAESGKEVGAEDVRAYFEELRGDKNGGGGSASAEDGSGGSGGRTEQSGY